MQIWALYEFNGRDEKIIKTFETFEEGSYYREKLKAESPDRIPMLNLRCLEDI